MHSYQWNGHYWRREEERELESWREGSKKHNMSDRVMLIQRKRKTNLEVYSNYYLQTAK